MTAVIIYDIMKKTAYKEVLKIAIENTRIEMEQNKKSLRKMKENSNG